MPNTNDLVLVTGGGGFIGGALVASFRKQGYRNIRAVDIKPFDHWYQRFDDVENLSLDLNEKLNCEVAARGAKDIYNLAANMGGMGFIEKNKALCMLSVLINTHMLQAAVKHGANRFFYASSACVYNGDRQKSFEAPSLKEEDAYPALAEDGYGCEKAPAAISRKVIEAKLAGKHEIEIWGTGHQTRSFMYIDDCLNGIQKIMNSDILEPINLGSSEAVSINQLVDMVEAIAGIRLKRNYDLTAPQGVNGRNSDNTLIKKYLGWEPCISLQTGMEKTYAWIYDQYLAREKGLDGVVKEFATT